MFEKGLSFDQAALLIQEHGRNELPESPPPSKLSLIISQFKSPLVYVLLVAAVVTIFLHEYTDAIVIGVAVFLNTVLGYIQEERAGAALQALKELIHPEAKVYRNGEITTLLVGDIVPGDVVVLSQGDKVPADGKLIFANRLFLTEAMLTGESVPVTKRNDDLVYMGTVVSAGQGEFLVEKTGVHTEIGKIAQSLDSIDEDTPLREQLAKFSMQLTILVLILTAGVAILGLVLGFSPREIFTTSVALAVSAIPEGLLVGLTVVLAIGMQRILAHKGLVRNLVSAETLGGVTTICVDKTGTLTQGKMQAVDIIGDEDKLLFQTYIANDQDDPIVIAAYGWSSSKTTFDLKQYNRLDSIPFNSDNKFFVSLNVFNNLNNLIMINGAPEVLIERANLSIEEKDNLYKKIEELSEQGKRLLGFARKTVPTEKTQLELSDVYNNLEWVGLIAFSDPVRLDVKDALASTKQAGIKLVVITGDYQKTAMAVLHQIGIDVTENDVIVGSDLEKMSDEELTSRLYADDNVKLFARTRPEQKMQIVQVLKNKQEIVAMMGDGVNDAPALTASDIGLVVGEATDVAKEAADIVLLDSSFKTIVMAIEEGRGIFDNIRKMILYLMCDAFVAIFLVISALILGLPLPITASQILWVNLISDGFPNLALTIDPKIKGIMTRKPRSSSEALVAPWMRELILVVSIISSFFAFMLYKHAFDQTQSVEFARSVAFAAVGINSLIYVFSVKTLKQPVWKSQPFDNKWLLLAVFGGLILQITPYLLPFLSKAFEIVPIGNYWFGIIGASFLTFTCIELMKWVFRHTHKY